METKVLSTLELNQLIAQKAKESEEFRLALLNDPKSAIKKEFDVVFPEDTTVEVHVENPKTLQLIIPAANTDELTDDQLEDVAGGAVNLNLGITTAYGIARPGGIGWNWPLVGLRR
ncbi:MAG: NHLP leader peptide family natural product precursor [Syntrophomonadaceae bacterium]|nr:NHLP leader peptide family natural product precursor [Syntrophomonadaceae bacterium]